MRRLLAALLLAVCLGAPALAKDSPVVVTLDGRPVDRHGGVAVARLGVVYGDVVDLVQAFDGVLTFHRNAVLVTIKGTTARFTVGSRTALIDQGSVVTSGAAFRRNGDIYVPLTFFVTRVAGAQVRIDKALAHARIYVNANPLS
ncbi:MAG TPA: stalk domain-containing protein [Candidatus Limnocylindria bacterium]|nr:stalk domain-containing protein [Candidatus Limnocylindria bacterium]